MTTKVVRKYPHSEAAPFKFLLFNITSSFLIVYPYPRVTINIFQSVENRHLKYDPNFARVSLENMSSHFIDWMLTLK